jgi:parallel beta-helix repeat protein
MRVIASIAIAALLSVGLAAPANAAGTRTVGAGQQYSNIQDAINASSTGDTVLVKAGTYNENIIIDGKYITLTGEQGATIRAANQSRAVVFIAHVPFNGGSNRVVVEGLTITGGDAPLGQGGGMTIFDGASPDIRNNTIEGNSANNGYGGGITVSLNSYPTIRNNMIRNNHALSGGGGIFAYYNSAPVIYGNTIENNTTSGASITNGGSSGGAIYLENIPGNATVFSYPIILNNTILNNSAEFAGGGVMVRTGVNATIEGNTIQGNTAAYGGGIHMETTGSTSTIADNIITGNTAPANPSYAGSGYGGGIALYDHSIVTLRSNTISGNQSSSGGAGVSSAEGANSQVIGNTISGNAVVPPTGGDGAGFYVANSTTTMTNNVFSSNTGRNGGGLGLLDGATATVSFNTFANNTATNGGGIFVRNVANVSASLMNNVMANNTGFQLYEEAHRAHLRNNLLYSGRSSNLYGTSVAGPVDTAVGLNSLGDSAGNVFSNPQFTNLAASDFSLQPNSGAIGLAEADPSPVVSDDIRGILRATMPRDIGAYEYESTPIAKQHVYRFWSDSKRGHFYTINKAERDQVASSYSPQEWRYESVAYDAFDTQIAGTIPLYRFYSDAFQGHFFTASAAEKDSVIANYPDNVWLYEGIAYYVYPLDTALASRAVWRFWSPDNRHHFYTASQAESDYVRANYPAHEWTFEGPNFKVPQ